MYFGRMYDLPSSRVQLCCDAYFLFVIVLGTIFRVVLFKSFKELFCISCNSCSRVIFFTLKFCVKPCLYPIFHEFHSNVHDCFSPVLITFSLLLSTSTDA